MDLPNGTEGRVLYNLEDSPHHGMGRRAVRKRKGELMDEFGAVGIGSE